MRPRQPAVPRVWLISDARNDAALEAALRRLPRGSGFVFRHDYLTPGQRRARFAALLRIARRRGHRVHLSGSERQARRWRADGSYGAAGAGAASTRLATAHDLREIAAARRARAVAVMLSPVFPTRSHPGAKPLGRTRFLLLARRAGMPVIALGGMTARRARGLPTHGWAAIDGLSAARVRPVLDADSPERA